MRLFSYKAVDKSGKIVKGSLEENNSSQVARHLKKLELTPLEIKKTSLWNTDVGDISIGGKINKGELSLFCGQLSFALDAGVPLNRALQTIYRNDLSVSPKLRNASLEISEMLQKGEGLSLAFEKAEIFPRLVVAMSEVGERSGSLPTVMRRLSKYYEIEHKISSEIINALIYPAIVSVMMLGVVILALVYVLPRYAEMFLAGDVDLPLPTLILIGLSEFVVGNYVLLITVLLALILTLYFSLRTVWGNTLKSWLKLNFPLFSGVYVKALNSRFVQALFIMTDSGMEITSALESAVGVLDNGIMEDALNRVTDEMRAGESLSVSIARIHYFDRLLPSMISIAEEGGKLPEILEKCAAHLQKETETSLLRLNKLVEPAVTLTLGALLAFIMLAIMLPTFYMTNMM